MKVLRKNNVQKILQILGVNTFIASTLIYGSAKAALGQITLPFEVGKTWYVCQGYQGTVSHQNNFALDLSIGQDFGATACSSNDVNRSAGQQILSPATGTIAYVGSDLVCLMIDGNRSLLIGHINRSIANGAQVNRDTVLGTVSNAAPANGNFAHIHIEARKSRNCVPNTSVPLTATYGFQLEGIGDLPDTSERNDHFRTALTRRATGGKIFQRVNDGWLLRPGIGNDIASNNGHQWLVGANSVYGGYGIYQWNGNDWNAIDGGAVGIAVSPSGNPWIINNEDYIYRRENNIWQLLPGRAKDIDIGKNGQVWIVGANEVNGGHPIWYWHGTDWTPIDGGAIRIAVDPAGNPWIVNNEGYIYRRVNDAWQLLPGRAKDIDIGDNGQVWIVGTNEVTGGYGIYQWNGSNWDVKDGGAVRIAVDKDGNPWVVNNGE
ncbi:tectonin domain-containing protein [Leptothoe sp. ISB3NOV94-8A]